MSLASACSLVGTMSLETGTPSWRLVFRACLMLLVVGMARFFVKLYRIRYKFQQMQKEGLVSLAIGFSYSLLSFNAIPLTSCTANASTPPSLWTFAISRWDHV